MKKQIGAIATLLVGLASAAWILAPTLQQTWERISEDDALRNNWIWTGFTSLVIGAVLFVLLLAWAICRLVSTRAPEEDTWGRDRAFIGARCVIQGASHVEHVIEALGSEALMEGLPDETARETFRKMAKALLEHCVLWVDSPATGQIDGDFPPVFGQWRNQIIELRQLIQQSVFDPINDGNIGPGKAIRTVAARCPAVRAKIRQLREAAELVAGQNRPDHVGSAGT